MIERRIPPKLQIYWRWIALTILAAIISIATFSVPNIVKAQDATFAATPENPLCEQIDFQKLANRNRPTLDSVVLKTESQIIPDGEIVTVQVSKPSAANTIFCSRIHGTAQKSRLVEIITAENSLDGYTTLTLKLPSVGWNLFYTTATLDLASIPFDQSIGKYQVESPNLYISQNVKISSWSFSFIGSILAVIISYMIAAIAICQFKKNLEFKDFIKKEFLPNVVGYLNPVTFTSDKSGKANISNFQITWFTLVVFGLLVHILLRTGELSPVSEDILWLLGISAAGKIVSRGINVSRNRLSLENWSWLYNQKWLMDAGQLRAAKWGDLIMTDGSFDVYKYQLLIFSFIVGITLTVSGLKALTAFSLPEGFVSLLGLSNVVYIFGITTSPNSIGELNTHLDKLRELEKEYSKDPEAYMMKARDVAGMLVLVYGKEFTTFNSGITDTSLKPKSVLQDISS